ncbi:MAG: T9SS type A sorting domain-containing protein [Flavobacteriales bacterium]
MRAITTLLSVLITSALLAQSPYRPFPAGNAGWVENHEWLSADGTGFIYNYATRTVLFANDTTIAGTVYHQLRSRGEGTWHTTSIPIQSGALVEPDAVFVCFREDVPARKVYAYDIYAHQEVLWYDFTLGLGDYPQTYDQPFDDGTVQVVALDSMELNDGWHRTWVLAIDDNGVQHDSAYCTVIEGVGTTFGLNAVYGLQPPFEWYDALSCHSAGGFTVLPFGDMVCDLAMGTHPVPTAPRALSCFPNPANNSVTITGPLEEGARYEVCDARGALLQTGTLHNTTINVGTLAPAPYVIRLVGADGTALGALRVMKE